MRRTCILLVLLAVVVLGGPFLADALFEWGRVASVLPPEGRRVPIGEGRHLNVYERGTGTPIVLVHGWGSSAADWAELPERLAAMGHRVIVYDRAGYGFSTRLEASNGNFTYASNARDLIALLDALQIEQATLVGWSFGGGVVQIVAVEAPERVTALALVASTGPGQADSGETSSLLDRILVSPLGSSVLSWAAKVPPLSWRWTHQGLTAAFSGSQNVPTGWTIRTQAMLGLPRTSRTLSAETARSDPNTLEPGRIRARTLVFQGSDDALVAYTVGENLDRALPHSAFVGVVGGSHMLPVTHPDALAKGIDRLAGSEYAAGQLPDGRS
ncbi:MAG: alpha/beta hydrolase [Deltaproteobacteria bacterium]|jgi:pimeloyl-ACP methyl ester carboxylesterase|nr:alpha/beta hydrolase [Deltaproteobacteria bacterium]